MSFPTKNDILIGISFVFVGIISALCDKWQVAVDFKGAQSPHIFDHVITVWTLKQIIQLTLLVFWLAIEKNWLGFGYFRHGDIVHRANPHGRTLRVPGFYDNKELHFSINEEEHDGNGHLADDHVLDNVADGTASNLFGSINGENDIENEVSEDEDESSSENKELVPLLGEKKLRRIQNKKPSLLIYLPPAVFSQAHVLLMFFGLKLTYQSSFIMLKGTVTFFTALLSVAFLAQQLPCYVWFGVIVATLGFGVSGISDYIDIPEGGFEKYGIAAGNLLIVMAQIMFATKIIYEEKFIRKHSIHPMMFLGGEAFYGTICAVIFLIAFNFVDAAQYSSLPNQKLEDSIDANFQFCHDWRVVLAVLGSLAFYILFTYLGLFLIRDHGALPRIMIETFVWIVFWAVCLALQWEHFFIAQVPGLCIIAIGALIYSHILVLPFSSRLDGIDNAGGSFSDQFMDLARPDNNQPDLRNGDAGDKDGDGNVAARVDNRVRDTSQEDDSFLNNRAVVEVHQAEMIDETQQEM